MRTVLSFPGINVKALNKAGETALSIAEKYFNEEIASILREADTDTTIMEVVEPIAPSSTSHLKQTVNFIKLGVQSHRRRSHRTQQQVQDLKKRVQKMNYSGLNNAVCSVNVVATLIASVAYAAIFQVRHPCRCGDSRKISLLTSSNVCILEYVVKEKYELINQE